MCGNLGRVILPCRVELWLGFKCDTLQCRIHVAHRVWNAYFACVTLCRSDGFSVLQELAIVQRRRVPEDVRVWLACRIW